MAGKSKKADIFVLISSFYLIYTGYRILLLKAAL